MQTITSKEVRHSLPRVLKMLKSKGSVRVTQRGKPIFEIHPARSAAWAPPDFSGRAEKAFGSKYLKRDLTGEIER